MKPRRPRSNAPIVERVTLWSVFPDAVLLHAQQFAEAYHVPRRQVLRAAALLSAGHPPDRAVHYSTLREVTTRTSIVFGRREGRLAVRRVSKLRFHETLPWLVYYGLTALAVELDAVLSLPSEDREATLARFEAVVYVSSLEVKPCPIPSSLPSAKPRSTPRP